MLRQSFGMNALLLLLYVRKSIDYINILLIQGLIYLHYYIKNKRQDLENIILMFVISYRR